MSNTTKAKINLKDGTVELEGSEIFVSKYLELFRSQIQNFKTSEQNQKGKKNEEYIDTDKKLLPKRKSTKIPQSVAPIPLDLKAKDGKSSLREFFREKNPKNKEENLTVFAYYLKHYLGISDMQAGHVVSCCKEVGQKVPTSIPSMFKNIQHRKAWLDVGTGAESAQITTQGENFVEYDLPRKEDVTKDKTAA